MDIILAIVMLNLHLAKTVCSFSFTLNEFHSIRFYLNYQSFKIFMDSSHQDAEFILIT